MTPLLRWKFTLTFLLTMLLANAATGTLSGSLPLSALADWGISHQSILEGDLLRLVTGTFLSHDIAMFARQLAFAAIVIGYYEWRVGTWRAAAMFFAIDITGSLIVLFAVLPLAASLLLPQAGPSVFQDLDVGMSAGGFGLIGATVYLQPRKGALLGLLLIGIAAKIWLDFEIIADSAHLLCLLMGFFAQMAQTPRDQPTARTTPQM